MKGVCLNFYTYETEKHHGIVLYEWLLEWAKKNGIHGGTAFRGIAGFGRHGVLHEEHFFELASNVPVKIEFLITMEESDKLINMLKAEGVKLFYYIYLVEFGS